jgi:hypothetical protein
LGTIEASTTLSLSVPWTDPDASTTAPSSGRGPSGSRRPGDSNRGGAAGSAERSRTVPLESLLSRADPARRTVKGFEATGAASSRHLIPREGTGTVGLGSRSHPRSLRWRAHGREGGRAGSGAAGADRTPAPRRPPQPGSGQLTGPRTRRPPTAATPPMNLAVPPTTLPRRQGSRLLLPPWPRRSQDAEIHPFPRPEPAIGGEAIRVVRDQDELEAGVLPAIRARELQVDRPGLWAENAGKHLPSRHRLVLPVSRGPMIIA